jgi:hypothetical protein
VLGGEIATGHSNGENMKQHIRGALRRLVGAPRAERRSERWAYFGSFGDDFFSDD